jgi:DNA polymerase-3 subunit beta
MKFSTSKAELQKALQKLSKATPTRTTLPILACVYIEAKKNKTILRSTDLELTIEINIPSSLETEGATCLPLKTLLEITNELPDTRITITVDSKNRAKIITDIGEYDLMGKSPEEFPQPVQQDAEKKIDIKGKDLKNIIGATLFAVSRDELKPALTGVLFKFTSEELIAVATDGHRLVKHKRKDIKTQNFNGEVIIPKKFLSYMLSHLNEEQVFLLIGESHISAKVKKDIISTRIIGERFPDYESVIPKDNDKVLKTEKEAFFGAIKRVSIFSNKSTHQVAISLSSSSSSVTTEDPEKSSKAIESINATFKGDDLTIGYNAEYLKDIVNHIQGKIIIANFSTPVSAALFSSTSEHDNIENLMLLMPIRLND